MVQGLRNRLEEQNPAQSLRATDLKNVTELLLYPVQITVMYICVCKLSM